MDLILTFIIIYIVEGLTDFNIEKSQDYKKKKYIRNWHISDFIMWIVVVGLVCYLEYGFSWESLFNLSFIGLIRNFVLNTTLNIQRGKPLYYLGSSGIDGILKPTEKLWWAVSALVIIFVSVTVYIVK